jgi:hypothetical protein
MGVDFSEGASAKWIFDVEIEKKLELIFLSMSRRPKPCLVVKKNIGS